MKLNIRASEQSCGAEVTGVDLTKELLEKEVKLIREAWILHHVLSFPDQPMNDDDLERFTLNFGSFALKLPFKAPSRSSSKTPTSTPLIERA